MLMFVEKPEFRRIMRMQPDAAFSKKGLNALYDYLTKEAFEAPVGMSAYDLVQEWREWDDVIEAAFESGFESDEEDDAKLERLARNWFQSWGGVIIAVPGGGAIVTRVPGLT